MAHALTAYVTKPLHLLGVVELDFKGWKTLDEGELIAWDLLFYEPWFLALGLLVTVGALHMTAEPAAPTGRAGGCWSQPRRARSP